ncbi:MAG: DUF86 domain-containing protein [Bacteroidales bacterium]|jgi:uncharacterized protein with HEPN domain|nr:DUF86 domain-containing protein [Bacteroidales bacterium]
MDSEIQSLLYDILRSIEEIDSFFADRPKLFDDYKKDVRTKRAVERNIEIIGEATNRILKINQHIEISNARKIVEARNRIIHGYDSISDEVIWGIVVRHLPLLKMELSAMIEKSNTNLKK